MFVNRCSDYVQIYFQQHGTPSSNCRSISRLVETIPIFVDYHKWIRSLPPRLPDINFIDFYL